MIDLDRKGLSLVEIIVAILILSMGILGLAAGTSWTIRAIDLAELDTKRAAALQSAVERVKAIPFAQVGSGSTEEGIYRITWAVTTSDQNSKTMRFILLGPGRAPGAAGPNPQIVSSAADTLVYRIHR